MNALIVMFSKIGSLAIRPLHQGKSCVCVEHPSTSMLSWSRDAPGLLLRPFLLRNAEHLTNNYSPPQRLYPNQTTCKMLLPPLLLQQ